MKNILLFTFLVVTLYAQAQKPAPSLLVVQEQQCWTPGDYFKAKVYLLQTQAEDVDFFYGDLPLMKDSAGAGIIEFRVSSGTDYLNGEAIREKRVSAKYKKKQKSVILTNTFTYLVKRAVVVYKMPVEGVMYAYCGNELFIDCPEMGMRYNPSFQSDDGFLIKGSERGQLTVISGNKETTISVSSDGTILNKRKFNVFSPPSPAIRLLLDSIPCTTMQAVSSKSKLIVSIEPDASFSSNYRKDARYSLAQGSLIVKRKGVTVASQLLIKRLI